MSDLRDINKFLAKLVDQWDEFTLEQRNSFTLTLSQSGPDALDPLLKAYESAREDEVEVNK